MQYVKFHHYNSKQIETKSAAPPRSILGPLLFCIYINNLVLASDKINYIMYADDTTLYFTLQDFPSHNFEEIVNYEVGKITNLLNFNKLSLNTTKTKSMMFHTMQRHMDTVSFTINNENIEKISSFNFLGIHLDENLTWNKNTNMLTNKLSKVLGILNRLKYIYPQHILLIIYNSLFMSHVNYGNILWGSCSNKIANLQKKAIRILTNSRYHEHTEPLLKAYGLLKVQDIYYSK